MDVADDGRRGGSGHHLAPNGDITFTILQGKGLGNLTPGEHKIHPYLNIRLWHDGEKKGNKQRTDPKDSTDPIWDSSFVFPTYDFKKDIFEMHLWDKRLSANQSLGTLSFNLASRDSSSCWNEDIWVDVLGGTGKVHIKVSWTPCVRRTLDSASLAEYSKWIQSNDPQKLGKKPKVKGLHEMVSLKKKRFHDDKYHLDLAYITDQIIAMGFPAEGMEKIYRNSMVETQQFLNEYHLSTHKVYNLCSERSYPANRFYQSACYPFDDHNVPPFELLYAFCKDASDWLSASPDNVVAIHCKAGKGRTGLMICALLGFRYGISVQECQDFYAERRTYNCKGVTIPSQRRWIDHFDAIKAEMKAGKWDPDARYQIKEIRISNSPKDHLNLFISCKTSKLDFEWKQAQKVPKKSTNEEYVYDFTAIEACVNRETKITCYDTKDDKKPYFWVWFHTKFVPKDGKLIFRSQDCDKLKGAPTNFSVVVTLQSKDDAKERRESKKKEKK